MKKIIILSERFPYPPTSGTKNLLFNYCKILHNELNMEVVNISFLEQDDELSLKPDFISRTYPLPNPSGKAKLCNLILKTLIQRKYPIQVSLFWEPKIKDEINRIIEIEKPDYIIADFIRTTEYIKDYPGYKIADLQDLLSLRYARQMQMDLRTINPYGAYLFRLPRLLQSVLQLSVLKKAVMKTEVRLLRDFEKNVGRQYDRVMFVARSEGERFDDIVGDKKSLTVPLGVDYNYFSEDLSVEKIPYSIAFMGALNVAHNENGIIHFVNHVFPQVLKRVPEAKLYIIGGGAEEKVKELESSNIILTGRVDDVRLAVGACEVFICPLQFGSGIKTKNLEAMAMGMPVVTTWVGAENIGAEHGADWLISEDDSCFAEDISKLLVDPDMRKTLGQNGQAFVKDNFTWELACNAFKDVFVGE